MMGLSSMGSGGGGNSSSSNLSASAPPFTVDRLNPKPNSSPLLHYSDSSFVVEPFSHPSQYAHLSAPRVEPAIDSNEIIGVPVSDAYRFSASASATPSSTRWSAHSSAFGGDVKPPYYNPYVPPLVGDENLLTKDKGSHYGVALTSGLGVTSQHDYTRSLFGLEYGPQWTDSLGLDDGKQAKRSEFDGNFSSEKQYVGGSHAFENQPYRGGRGCENRDKFKEDSGVLYKNPNQVSDRVVYSGSLSTGYVEDKSCLDQHLGFFHYDSSETLLSTSSSSYPESYPSVISCAMQKDFPNYQNSINPYEKCVRPVDTPFPGRVSVTRSSPTVVIRPPPATNCNSGQGAASRKPSVVHIVNSDYTYPSKPNNSGLKPNSKPEGDSFESTVVIRPPPAVDWNFRQGAASRKRAGVHIVDTDYTNPSKPNDSGLKPNSKPEGDSFETTAVIRPPPAFDWNLGQGAASRKPAGVHIVDTDYTYPSKTNDSGQNPNSKPEGDSFETTVVIRPPPAVNWNLGQDDASRKPDCVHFVDTDYTNPSKPNNSGLKPNSKPEGDSFETSFFKSSMQGNSLDSSILVKELSSPLHSMDTSDYKIEATLGSQMPEVNVSRCLIGCNIQVVNSSVESPDLSDHHNTAVDSPCWRGAPSSQFSMFDIEAGNSNHVEINLIETGLGHGEHQSLLSTIDSNKVFSEEVECNKGKENECGKPCEMLGLENALDAICSTTEQASLGCKTDRVWIPPMTRTKGVELSGSPNMMTEELNFLNNLTSVFDTKVSDTKHLFGEDGPGMTVIDVSEGAAVAVQAAEKVLASPASQEDASEQTTVPDLGLDVPSIVKTIYSLSELLQFHISNDECSLGEENTEILEHVISSLSSCLSKKGTQAQAANNPEPKGPVGETSGNVGDSSSMCIISGDHAKCESSNSCTKPDYLHCQKGGRNCIFTGEKDEISHIILPSRDDLHITGDDDDMAKAIMKVLEQNFHIDEDVHSQALLFKSLWLDSEAKLCSISYKARFERMKNQMEEVKLKASKANEDIAEMTSEHCMSPDPITVSELAPEPRGGTLPKPTSPNNSTSGMSRHADDIEDSVLARFNILKRREENPKALNTEDQQRSEMVAGKHADTIMARLKSREENSKPISSMEEEKALNDEFAGEKYFRPCIRSQSEDEALDVALQPESRGGKFNSYFERAGYESPIHLVKSGSRAINENNSRWRDSSSEWEHVLKEDVSWKN